MLNSRKYIISYNSVLNRRFEGYLILWLSQISNLCQLVCDSLDFSPHAPRVAARAQSITLSHSNIQRQDAVWLSLYPKMSSDRIPRQLICQCFI